MSPGHATISVLPLCHPLVRRGPPIMPMPPRILGEAECHGLRGIIMSGSPALICPGSDTLGAGLNDLDAR